MARSIHDTEPHKHSYGATGKHLLAFASCAVSMPTVMSADDELRVVAGRQSSTGTCRTARLRLRSCDADPAVGAGVDAGVGTGAGPGMDASVGAGSAESANAAAAGTGAGAGAGAVAVAVAGAGAGAGTPAQTRLGNGFDHAA